MLDDARLLAIWFEFNDAFNRGDLEACAAGIADDFNGMASQTFMATKDDFMAAARNGRSNGSACIAPATTASAVSKT